MDITKKIANKDYESKLPYPEGHHTKEERTAMRIAVREDNNRLRDDFKKDAFETHGLTGHPKAEKIWDYAIDHGDGYREINDIIEDLAEIAL